MGLHEFRIGRTVDGERRNKGIRRDPLAVTVVGLKLAEAPVGNPLALNVTVPVNPFSAPIVTVYVVELPAVTV